jgi:hypothetical protein
VKLYSTEGGSVYNCKEETVENRNASYMKIYIQYVLQCSISTANYVIRIRVSLFM